MILSGLVPERIWIVEFETQFGGDITHHEVIVTVEEWAMEHASKPDHRVTEYAKVKELT